MSRAAALLGAPLGATGRVGRGAVLTRRSVSARDTVGACSQYVSSAGSESHAMCDHESGPSAQPTRLRYVGAGARSPRALTTILPWLPVRVVRVHNKHHHPGAFDVQ